MGSFPLGRPFGTPRGPPIPIRRTLFQPNSSRSGVEDWRMAIAKSGEKPAREEDGQLDQDSVGKHSLG